MSIKKFILISALAVSIAACAKPNVIVPAQISKTRGVIPGTETVNYRIKRSDYIKSLANPVGLKRLRLVRLLVRGADNNPELPEHRLFDILPDSPAALLRLQNADILIAANDFVIHDPLRFKKYLELLKDEKNAQIEIRRNGTPMLFKYEFVD